MEDIILYHGSRGSITGEILPTSREKCDFGKGFYMGENQGQAKGLVVRSPNPILYTIRLKLSEIPENKILILSGMDWINTVLACRKSCDEFNSLKMAKKALSRLDNYDVIIGAIADDRMNEAVRRFSEYGLTDKGLLACLQSVNYGMQYVAKTKFACSKAEIIDQEKISGVKADYARKYAEEKRAEGKNVVREMAIKYQREGLYLNEILRLERKKEREEQERE